MTEDRARWWSAGRNFGVALVTVFLGISAGLIVTALFFPRFDLAVVAGR